MFLIPQYNFCMFTNHVKNGKRASRHTSSMSGSFLQGRDILISVVSLTNQVSSACRKSCFQSLVEILITFPAILDNESKKYSFFCEERPEFWVLICFYNLNRLKILLATKQWVGKFSVSVCSFILSFWYFSFGNL